MVHENATGTWKGTGVVLPYLSRQISATVSHVPVDMYKCLLTRPYSTLHTTVGTRGAHRLYSRMCLYRSHMPISAAFDRILRR